MVAVLADMTMSLSAGLHGQYQCGRKRRVLGEHGSGLEHQMLGESSTCAEAALQSYCPIGRLHPSHCYESCCHWSVYHC